MIWQVQRSPQFSATDTLADQICANYRLDQKRRKLINERRQYIGVSGKADYSAMCEDISFLHQSLKTVLSDHIEIF